MAQGVGRQKLPPLAPSREFFPVYREFGGVEDAQELGKGSFSSVALLLQQGSAAIPSQGFQLLWQSVEIHLEYAEKARVRPKENSIFLFFFFNNNNLACIFMLHLKIFLRCTPNTSWAVAGLFFHPALTISRETLGPAATNSRIRLILGEGRSGMEELEFL